MMSVAKNFVDRFEDARSGGSGHGHAANVRAVHSRIVSVQADLAGGRGMKPVRDFCVLAKSGQSGELVVQASVFLDLLTSSRDLHLDPILFLFLEKLRLV